MSTHTPREARNLALATEMYERVIVAFDASEIERFFAPGYIQHGSLARDGQEGLREFINGARHDFPEARVTIRRAFADGDFVIFHVRGQLGPDHPVAAVVDIFRLGDGLVQEHWEVIQELPDALPHGNGSF